VEFGQIVCVAISTKHAHSQTQTEKAGQLNWLAATIR